MDVTDITLCFNVGERFNLANVYNFQTEVNSRHIFLPYGVGGLLWVGKNEEMLTLVFKQHSNIKTTHPEH